jgi:hypothetical protein
MPPRFSGQTTRRYDEHAEHSRRLLFAKDREITRQQGRATRVLSTLEYIAAVTDGKVGGHDPEWQLGAIREALTSSVRRTVSNRHTPAGDWSDDWEVADRGGDGNAILRHRPSGGLYRILPLEES